MTPKQYQRLLDRKISVFLFGLGVEVAIVYAMYKLFQMRHSLTWFKLTRPAMKVAADYEFSGKRCIITGANQGIGKETARALYSRGGHIVMGCRDDRKCMAAKKEIEESLKHMDTTGKLYCAKLDLSDLGSIQRFVDSLDELGTSDNDDSNSISKSDSEKEEAKKQTDKQSTFDSIDVLINNAGVMGMPLFQTSKQNLEKHFAVNHLGHFYLTRLLFDRMKKAGQSRVINVSSMAANRDCPEPCSWLSQIENDLKKRGHRCGGPPPSGYEWKSYYAFSKALNMIHAAEIQRSYFNNGGSDSSESFSIGAVSLHPGVIPTQLLVGSVKWYFRPLVSTIGPWTFLKNAEKGASTTVKCAMMDHSELDGKFWKDGRNRDKLARYDLRPDDMDVNLRNQVWRVSEDIIRAKGFPVPSE